LNASGSAIALRGKISSAKIAEPKRTVMPNSLRRAVFIKHPSIYLCDRFFLLFSEISGDALWQHWRVDQRIEPSLHFAENAS
jgi:hypothetical protein